MKKLSILLTLGLFFLNCGHESESNSGEIKYSESSENTTCGEFSIVCDGKCAPCEYGSDIQYATCDSNRTCESSIICAEGFSMNIYAETGDLTCERIDNDDDNNDDNDQQSSSRESSSPHTCRSHESCELLDREQGITLCYPDSEGEQLIDDLIENHYVCNNHDECPNDQVCVPVTDEGHKMCFIYGC